MPFKFNPLLAPEGETSGGGASASASAPDAAPAAAPPAEPAPAERVVTRTGKVLPMTEVSIDQLKKEQREKGRRAYEADLLKRAKQLGCETVDDMFKLIERAKNGGGKNRPAQNA